MQGPDSELTYVAPRYQTLFKVFYCLHYYAGNCYNTVCLLYECKEEPSKDNRAVQLKHCSVIIVIKMQTL